MSAPLVAGLAGLVISKFTNITTQQLVERIRATCDQIEDKNLSNYKYLLGSGRINAHRAVSDEKIFSLRATNAVFGVVNSSVPNDDDTIRVELEFTNFLTPISNVKISLSCRDSFVRFINNQLEIGSLHELEKTKAQSIFFVLDNYAPTDTSIFILVKYEAAGYFDFQWLPVKINPSFVTLNNDKIEVSVTNKGGIGYSDLSHLRGVGFRTVNGNNFLSEGAQMIGTSADKLIDGVRINSISISSDLTAQKSISLRKNNLMSESFAYFNDNNSGTSRLGIQTRVHSYIFNTAPDNSYLLFEVTIKNITLLEIKNLYLGYFLDINLSDDGLSDSTSYDNTDKFAYVINKNSHNGIVGAALLTNQKDCYAGINNNWHVGEMILADGFQDEEKWYSISNGILKEKVFGNVSFTVGGGPVSVLPSGEETFAFVVAPASSKEELRQIIRQSRKKYITLDVMNEKIVPLEYKLYQNYPNPFNPSTTIQYSIPVVGTKSATTTHVTLKVYDVLGREIATLVDEDKSPGTYEVQFNTSNAEPKRTIPTGVYFYRLQTGDFIQTKKMILLK
ncbi:MAG: S8 family peptidase [Ignavibacteriales bacterium]|nr:S8 family peptidase [Ignavibacteriales bacterium]